jgi:DNA-directed RNA polymerase specialized sigma24 family protein
MGYDELKNVSHEDLKLFEERLTAFFKMSVDDSFLQLRKQLKNRFSRSHPSNTDELIDITISRLIKKVAQFEKSGDRIQNLTAFAMKMAPLIISEYERGIKKSVALDSTVGTADSESTPRPREFPYQPDPEIRAIEKEIERDCMTACLKELSAEKQALLLGYYPDESVTPQERKRLREQLALREAGAEPGTASVRQINNLQAKVSKVKSKLSECFEQCWNSKRSRSSNLVFLEALRARE